MARVNVDSQALTDARFAVLASLMGSDDPDLALGRMIRVWMQCLERETYVITQPVIVALFRGNPDAPEWLVRAELAEPVEGGFRIKGTKGRIEYLAEQRARSRENGSKGGRPPKTQRVSGHNPGRLASKTPPAPAPAPAPVKEENPPTPLAGGDDLSKAIAEVSGTDLATNSRAITKAAEILRTASPTYTADEVREFGRRYWELCPLMRDKKDRPSAAEIRRKIGLVRSRKKAAKKPTPPLDAVNGTDKPVTSEEFRDILAKRGIKLPQRNR